MLKQSLVFLTTLLLLNVAQASNRQVLAESSSKNEDAEIEEVEEMLMEQSILERLLINNTDIVVTPYYDQYGRAGAKVVPNEGEPYYVDPHYDDPMQTNRHSDEANTDSNWRVFTWGE